MKQWEIDRTKRAIQSCKEKIKNHYERTRNKVSNAIRNEYTKIEALEKQIPKKPLCISGDYDAPICPECKQLVDDTELYCSTCGQALDWSDAE